VNPSASVSPGCVGEALNTANGLEALFSNTTGFNNTANRYGWIVGSYLKGRVAQIGFEPEIASK
jgi:LAS superfamily LD-carboxypeptidase LdcB